MRNRRVREFGWHSTDKLSVIPAARPTARSHPATPVRADQAKSKQKNPINPAIANPAPATCISVAKRMAECRFDD
jgi:hypothetical protein